MKFDNVGQHSSTCNCSTCQSFTSLSRLVVGEWPPLWAGYSAPTVSFSYDIEMPGTKRESIVAKLKGETLKLSWSTRLGEGKTQSIPFDKTYDLNKLSCSYQDGLLKIYVPLKETQPPVPAEEPEIDIEIK